MIIGALSPAGAPAEHLPGIARLRAAGCELTLTGPLALTTTGREISRAERDGVLCVLDGRLHAPPPSSSLGADGAGLRADAERVAVAYLRGGVDALAGLRGRFSLVIRDEAAGRVLLAADLLATRQVYWAATAGQVAFASEIADLLAVLPSRPGPDPVAFPTWLAGGLCPEGRTLYDGIHRLGPGQCAASDGTGIRTLTYWRPRFAGTIRADRAQVADGLRHRLLRAAGRRRTADKDGVVLSGGLDSSIVAAAAHAAGPAPGRLTTYSAVFPGEPFDESAKITALTRHLGVGARTVRVAPQGMLTQALAYLRRRQVPLAGMGALVEAAAVSRAGADGARAVLDGQTGDEVLGFTPYLIADRLRHGRLAAAARLIERWPGRPPATLHQRAWLAREVGVKGALPHRLGQGVRARRAREGEGPPWLLPHLRARHAELEDRWAWKRRGDGPLWWRHLADLQVYGPHREPRLEYLRHRADAAGVIGESPLYDPDLIGYCLSIDPALQFDPRHDRPLARAAMADLLPDAVRLQTVKADFSPFCQAAIAGPDAAGLQRVLTAPDAEIGAYVDLDWVRRTWPEVRGARGGVAPQLGAMWHLACAETWLRLQSDPGWIDALTGDPALAEVAVAAPAPA